MRQRKRPAVSLRVKIGLTAALVLVAIGVLMQMLYRQVHASEWTLQDAAVKRAYEQTILAEAERVEPFVGELPYEIIYGTDKLGQRIIVWLADGDLHTEYETDGVSEDAIVKQLRASNPKARLMRVSPGKLLNDYVWEAFYKQKEDDDVVRYYYNYYRFADGELLDTFRLSLQ